METLISFSDFYETIADDPRIGPGHIVVYFALLHVWLRAGTEAPFEVATYEMLQLTKIRKRDTYLTRIKDLAMFGYIKYVPAENEYVKAVVEFKRL